MYHSTVYYTVVQCSTVQYSAVQCTTVQCSVLQCRKVQKSTGQCCTVQIAEVFLWTDPSPTSGPGWLQNQRPEASRPSLGGSHIYNPRQMEKAWVRLKWEILPNIAGYGLECIYLCHTILRTMAGKLLRYMSQSHRIWDSLFGAGNLVRTEGNC